MSASPRPDWATIPNAVTLLRLALLVPLCLLLLQGPDTAAVLLLAVWASTDWVDGLLARRLGQASRTGEILDPIADRVGMAGVVLTLSLMDLLPWAVLVIILVADLAMTVGASRAALGGRIGVSVLGKLRTVVLMTSVSLLVAAAAWAPGLLPVIQGVLWVGVVLHVVTVLGYVLSARRAGGAAAAAGEPPSPR